MKKYYVYELVNLMGTIEYVGETTNPKNRFQSHKFKGNKFYKRADITMNIVNEFPTKKEAWKHQCELQTEYGLISDRETIINNSSVNKINQSKPIIATNIKTGLKTEFYSIKEFARQLNEQTGNICTILKGGKQKSAKGYTFEYKNID